MPNPPQCQVRKPDAFPGSAPCPYLKPNPYPVDNLRADQVPTHCRICGAKNST